MTFEGKVVAITGDFRSQLIPVRHRRPRAFAFDQQQAIAPLAVILPVVFQDGPAGLRQAQLRGMGHEHLGGRKRREMGGGLPPHIVVVRAVRHSQSADLLENSGVEFGGRARPLALPELQRQRIDFEVRRLSRQESSATLHLPHGSLRRRDANRRDEQSPRDRFCKVQQVHCGVTTRNVEDSFEAERAISCVRGRAGER